MGVYFAILLLSAVLSLIYVKDTEVAFLRVSVWMAIFTLLFLPAAFRYGIGTDYFMYIDAVEELRDTGECKMELSFKWICDFCHLFGESPQWVIGFYAFFTYLVILLAFKGKCFPVAIQIYILTAYSFTYNGMRQALAIALLTLAFSQFMSRHYSWMAILSALAVVIHTSAMVFLPLLCMGFGMICLRKRWVLSVFVIVAVGLFFVDISGYLMLFSQIHEKYALYAEQDAYANAANLTSGFGFWLRVLITSVIFAVLMLRGKDRNARLMAAFCGFSIWFSMIGLHLEIFRRFVCVTDFILPFAVAEMFATSASWGRWAGLAVIAGYVFIFSHDVCAEMFGKTVPNEVVPYRTIFSASGDSV